MYTGIKLVYCLSDFCCCNFRSNRPKIQNCLFPLYLPTQQNAPTQHILFANFKSRYNFFYLHQKRANSVLYYYIYIHILLNKKHTDLLPTLVLPTRYPQGPVGKWETNTFLSWGPFVNFSPLHLCPRYFSSTTCLIELKVGGKVRYEVKLHISLSRSGSSICDKSYATFSILGHYTFVLATSPKTTWPIEMAA
jgi:hypothetical protein